MSLDISEILKGWPYRHGQVSARRIRGRDGREKIQLRLDLGLLQMEAAGRPDGRRPHGMESLLDWHERRLGRHVQQQGEEEGFALSGRDCEMLRAEATLYYHRYLGAFVLGDYEAVLRDTDRNLRLMDFCRRFAREESDRYLLEEYRPYLLMMRARAAAQLALRDGKAHEALQTVRAALADIEGFYDGFGGEKLADQSSELTVLRTMEKDIVAQLPVDPVERLRRELADAVEAEHYEQAARIRDQLRRLTETT